MLPRPPPAKLPMSIPRNFGARSLAAQNDWLFGRIQQDLTPLSFCDDGVFENTHTFDLDADVRPWLEWSDTGGSACGNQVTWFQRHKRTYLLDYNIHVKKHIGNRGVLFLLSIQKSSDAQLVQVDFVAWNNAGAGGTEGIEA